MFVKKNSSNIFDEDRKRQVSFKEIIETPVENITSQNDLGALEEAEIPPIEKSGKKELFLEKRKSIEINEFPKSKEVLKLVEDAIEEVDDSENIAEH